MNDNNNIKRTQIVKFSKDNPVIEVSSKQNQVVKQNVVPPVRQKEEQKENRGN